MSDKPLGPDWWQAGDGTWHPPEARPSVDGGVPTHATPAAVPALDVPSGVGPVPGLPSLTTVAPMAPPAPPVPAAPATPPAVGTAADAPMATVELPPPGPLTPRPVPSLPVGPVNQEATRQPAGNGESDHRPEAGPMFPDLFQQAVAGSALASAVTVKFADGEHRETLDVLQSSGRAAEAQLLEAGCGHGPVEVGAFTGASAKKRRWRL